MRVEYVRVSERRTKLISPTETQIEFTIPKDVVRLQKEHPKKAFTREKKNNF